MAGNSSIIQNPDLDQWVEIGKDEKIYIHTGKVNIGQHISTALAIIASEELDVDYSRIDVKFTETGIDPNEGLTAGSLSMSNSGHAVRLATATARHFLLVTAADTLDVDIETLEVDDGLIRSQKTNQFVTYWELMGGEKFCIPIDQSINIKTPDKQHLIGQRVITHGMADMVSGRYKYVHDIKFPGMLHARPIRPPHYHARLKSLPTDIEKQFADKGITLVRDGSFLAVAGPKEFAVIKATERLASAAEWDMGNGLPTSELFSMLTTNERISLPVWDGAPHNEPVLQMADPPSDASVTISAEYLKPYHMHGSLGPSAACVVYQEGRLDIWSHTQGVYPLRGALALAFGMKEDDIHIIHTPGAGCYGHNGADDAVFDAALIARAIQGVPILLKWSRDDEHAWEPYGSAMFIKLRGSIDPNGKIIDWNHESYSDTFNMRPMPMSEGSPAGKLLGANYLAEPIDRPEPQPAMGKNVGIHRNLDPLYIFPKRRLVKNLVRGMPLRTSALRSLGAFGNVFAIEGFMDELAKEAGIQPDEFRLKHLDDKRAKDVIRELVKHMSADSAGSVDLRGKGIGFARYKNSAAYVAVGIELSVDDAAAVHVHRAWITCDAGEVVDSDGLTSQMEGGLIQAISWTLFEEVTWDEGGITSRDWDSYPILKFNNVPHIKTILINQPGQPYLGAGEAVTGPSGAAIANAIYNTIGVRMRRMPFSPKNIQATAIR